VMVIVAAFYQTEILPTPVSMTVGFSQNPPETPPRSLMASLTGIFAPSSFYHVSTYTWWDEMGGRFTNALGRLTAHGGTHLGINPSREELSAMCRPRKKMVWEGRGSNIPSRAANVDEQARVLPS